MQAISFSRWRKKKTLYYSADVRGKIKSTFTKELAEVPQGSENTTTKIINVISPPTFLGKEGQRLTFSSRRSYFVWRQENTSCDQQLNGLLSLTGLAGLIAAPPPGRSTTSVSTGTSFGPGVSLSGLAGTPSLLGSMAAQYDEIKRDGEIIFEVKWSATLTARGKLTRPQLLKIEYKATNWKE